METIAAKLFDFLIVSGTIGGWAFFVLLLLVLVYYKHLKPFFIDFYEMKEEVREEMKINKEIKGIIFDLNELKKLDISTVQKEFSKISHQLEDLTVMAENVSKATDVIVSKNKKELQEEIIKFHNIFTELKTTLSSHDSRADDKLQNLMIELTKLATRIEMNQQVSSLRGIQ